MALARLGPRAPWRAGTARLGAHAGRALSGAAPRPPKRDAAPPRGFESFWPPGGGGGGRPAAEPSRAARGAATAAAKGGGGGGGGGDGNNGSGGGSSSNNNNNRPPVGAFEAALLAAGVAVVVSSLDWGWLLGGGEGAEGGASAEARAASAGRREISMQQFLSQLLPSGRVRRLVVVNGQTVRVYIGDYPLHGGALGDGGGGAYGYEGGEGGGAAKGGGGARASTSESALLAAAAPAAATSAFGGGGGADGGADGGGGGALGGAAHDGGQLAFTFTIGSVEQFEARLDAAQAELGVPPEARVRVRYVTATSVLAEALRWVPTALLMGLMLVLYRGAQGGVGGAGGAGAIFQVGKSKAKRAAKVETRFKDVAGLEEAKAEVVEFVDFLKRPGDYTRLGARIPRGALLVGPPGCGKTLLAKAVAGESEAPFFSVSGSDFIEMFVGVGPARVRDMFAEARRSAPCLIFIDEIDAVGRARGRSSMGGSGNDERENTLNQLLIEMDGFASGSGVVVLAGTNRADVLDSALLRPGRFDRQIVVDKPDIKGREEIFGVHLRPLTLDPASPPADLANRLAALTPGMSGAEIANVCNEAALIAAREEASAVGMSQLDAAVDRVLGGLERKSRTQLEKERVTVAYHEAGHAVAGWFLARADPVMKVSIVPRGRAALGYSQSLPRDVALYSEEALEHMVRMALGGRAAEEICLGEVSTGAQNDMERVTNIAHQCVTAFGFSPRVGHVSFPPKGEESGELYRPYAEKTARIIDQEVRGRVAASYTATLELLRSKRPLLDALAQRLLEKEVVNADDLVEVLGPRQALEGDRRYDEYLKKRLQPHEMKAKAAPAQQPQPQPGGEAGGSGGGGGGGGGGMPEPATT